VLGQISDHVASTRRKLFLTLGSRALLRGVSTASLVTQMKAENPIQGLDFFKYERCGKTPSTFHFPTFHVTTAHLKRPRAFHYDTFRYLPTSERSLLPFFGGPVDISFNNSV